MSKTSAEHPATPVRQRTLTSAIGCSGIALHSGDKVNMTLHPAAADTGIVFRRTDIKGGGAEILATYGNVRDTRMCTTIGNEEGVTISTVEHLMAALSGAGIDNVVVEVNGGEIPIMDGSAAPFLFLIDCAGVVELETPRRSLRVKRQVVVSENGKTASLSPADSYSLDFEIDFDSAAISRQSMRVDFIEAAFKDELSRARTFGFMHEVEALRAAGLAKGGSLDNAVVVSGNEILNDEGLRFDNEFVRHKILDAIGDLYLAGGQIIGHFSGYCTGHALNNKLLRTLFADEANYEWINAPALAAHAASPVTGAWDREAIAASPAVA